jgi:hypothetical protein
MRAFEVPGSGDYKSAALYAACKMREDLAAAGIWVG